MVASASLTFQNHHRVSIGRNKRECSDITTSDFVAGYSALRTSYHHGCNYRRDKQMKVISIDPGVHTGYCYARITDAGRLQYHPFQSVDDVDELWRRLHGFQPRYIVIEKWEDRNKGYRGSKSSGVNSFPQQLIGVARLYALTSDHQCAIFEQAPHEGLGGFYSHKMLKQLGLLKRGDITNLQHGLSATQHLLQWATFNAGSQYISDRRDFIDRLEDWPPNE